LSTIKKGDIKMKNVTVLKITLEEVSVKLEKPRNEGNNNPK